MVSRLPPVTHAGWVSIIGIPGLMALPGVLLCRWDARGDNEKTICHSGGNPDSGDRPLGRRAKEQRRICLDSYRFQYTRLGRNEAGGRKTISSQLWTLPCRATQVPAADDGD